MINEDDMPEVMWMQCWDGYCFETHCQDKINDDDISYTRTDLIKRDCGDALEALDKLTGKAYLYAPFGTMEESETIRQALQSQPAPTSEDRAKALKVFEAIIEACEAEAECYIEDILNNMPVKQALETIRAALQEPVRVDRSSIDEGAVSSAAVTDVEGLKKDYKANLCSVSNDKKKGWNDCIDHLVSKGYLTAKEEEG